MVKDNSTSVAVRQPVLQVSVSPVQHAWLLAMGVDVPWIVGQTPSSDQVPVSAVQAPEQALAADPVTESLAPPPESLKTALQGLQRSKVSNERPTIEPTRTRALINSPAQINGQSLEALQAMIKECQACSLCEQRAHAVAGEGSQTPSVLIVGEAPGEQEDLEGRPFVGRSGLLLNNMLQSIALDRFEQVFITNVVKCRPPANRNPREDEIAACAPYLLGQIELLRPKVVLAMGRFAAHALLQTTEPLQKLRQQPQSITAGDKPIPVVVTYHPAYLLRRPVDKRLAWEDLKRVRAILAANP
jgi:uracil-DNA glycosylase